MAGARPEALAIVTIGFVLLLQQILSWVEHALKKHKHAEEMLG
jgi:hypothetical protein